MIKSNRPERRLLELCKTAVQGGLSETTRTCGSKGCACHTDPAKRHGPHLYLTFRTPEGRSSGMYIPREHEQRVRKAVEDWASLWALLVDIGRRNRENLRDSIQGKSKRKRTP